MEEDDKLKLSINASNIRFSAFLKIFAVVLFLLWISFFLVLHFSKYDLPRRTDITIMLCVFAVCGVIEIIETLFSKHFCKCPYCGRTWSIFKHKKFKRNMFDIFFSDGVYYCYNCDSRVDIKK